MIEMVAYNKEHIISKEKPQYISDFLQRFKQLYMAKGGKQQDVESYSVQHFTTKLKKEFNQNQIAIKADGTKETAIWKNASMSLTHATHLGKQSQDLKANIIYILYTGSDSSNCYSRKSHLIYSSAADAVYACSGERLIPGKHLENVNTVIGYGMFLVISSLKEKSSTFASFCRHILIKLLKLTNYRLDLCFDICKSPSIKDIQRKSRCDRDLENIYNVGPRQTLSADFAEPLNTSDFKTVFAFPF